MSEAAHDYSEFQEDEIIGDNLMARIEGLAQSQIDAEVRVANLEAELAEAKAALRDITEKQLPDLLDEAQLGESKITTPAGYQVELGEAIRGSIPKDKEEGAFAWLEANKNGRLIKRQCIIEFGKDQEAWARKFMADCAKRKRPLNMKIKRGVNAQTLQAFVRQKLKEGVDIPMDTFGVFRQRFAKVKVQTEK